MKLRLFGNSIRLRLTQDEVRNLAMGRQVEARTRFFHGQLDIDVLLGAEFVADIADSRIRVTLPAGDVALWAYSEDEGLYADNGVTKLAVEKDYACLHKAGELNTGTFPNPAALSDVRIKD